MMQTEISQCFDSIEDALRAAVQALGKSKVVGARLWGAKDPERAGRDLSDALNPESSRKLELDEIFKILTWARAVGFHAAKHFIDDLTGYEPSTPREPVVEQAKLLRDLSVQLAATQSDLLRAMEALRIYDKMPTHLREVGK